NHILDSFPTRRSSDLDENILIAEAYNGANSISSVSSTMTRDGEGNIYLAVTPSEDYDGVRIKLRSQSNLLGLSLGGGLDMNVYEDRKSTRLNSSHVSI